MVLTVIKYDSDFYGEAISSRARHSFPYTFTSLRSDYDVTVFDMLSPTMTFGVEVSNAK